MKGPTSPGRASVGRRGEALVASKLEHEGFEIVAQNARVGRLELDLIARRGPLLVVCEVRSLTSDRLYSPAESVDAHKQARIRRATAEWLSNNHVGGRVRVRFDVAAVVMNGPRGEPEITYYDNAF